MQTTSISLLTREGALSATFSPALTPPQYDQLMRDIKGDGDTRGELSTLLQRLAVEWGCSVRLDTP